MRSPPPTPRRRLIVDDRRDRQAADEGGRHSLFDPLIRAPTLVSRNPMKRTREEAGLITPRPTPVTERKGRINRVNDGTAKILFPNLKRRKVAVFQDPKTPDPFTDDLTNPFLSGGSQGQASRDGVQQVEVEQKQDHQSTKQPTLREDGMYYVLYVSLFK